MSELVAVLAVVLATHRVTHFIVADGLIKRARERVQTWFETRWERRHPGESDPDEWQSRVAYLLSCAWCTSIWAGAGTVAITDQFTSVPVPVLVWLASSSVSGLLSTRA